MQTLAIESSQKSAGIALLRDEQLIAEYQLTPQQTTARFLIPEINRLLVEADTSLCDVKLIAVSNGPGSFTGLRIGITAAKSLAYAIQRDVLSVGAMEVVAARAFENTNWNQNSSIWCLVDAHRNQLFASKLSCTGPWQIEISQPIKIVNREQVIELPSSLDRLSGPELARIEHLFENMDDCNFVDPDLRQPTAHALGILARHRFLAGHREDLFRLEPAYHRRSAAEEKRSP